MIVDAVIEQDRHLKIDNVNQDNVNHGRSRPPSYPVNNGNFFSKQSATNNLKVINTLTQKKVGISGSTLDRGKDIDKDKNKINVIEKSDGAKDKTESSIHLIGQPNSPKDRIGIVKPSSVDISIKILKDFDQLEPFDKDRCRQNEVNPNFYTPQLDGRGDEKKSFFSMQPLYSYSEESHELCVVIIFEFFLLILFSHSDTNFIGESL